MRTRDYQIFTQHYFLQGRRRKEAIRLQPINTTQCGVNIKLGLPHKMQCLSSNLAILRCYKLLYKNFNTSGS